MQLQKEQYHQYALNKNNELVFIDDARKEDGQYICPNCKEPLIVKNNGKIRQHHFAHKSGTECCWESYLHKCAKHLLKQLFDKNEKFEISYAVTNHCPKYDMCELARFNYWKECNGEFVYRQDLKQIYDTCEIERGYNGFIGDVKLSNSQDNENEPMFLEVLVNHKCSDEKINSGIKMIEIKVNSFEDIFKQICDQNPNIAFYNINRDLHKIWEHKLKHYVSKPSDLQIRHTGTGQIITVHYYPRVFISECVSCFNIIDKLIPGDNIFIINECDSIDILSAIWNEYGYFAPKCVNCTFSYLKRNHCYGLSDCTKFRYRKTNILNSVPYVFIKKTTNDTNIN